MVVSMPEGSQCGVVQYDLRKDNESSFQLKGLLLPPPTLSRNAVVRMQSGPLTAENKEEKFLSQMLQRDQNCPSTNARPPGRTSSLMRTTPMTRATYLVRAVTWKKLRGVR